MVRWVATAVVVAVVGGAITGCSMFGSTTKQQVCAEFDELGDRFLAANGFIDDLLFLQAGTLADVANRYDGAPDLSSDADALDAISDADQTTGLALMGATTTIAQLCGHVLGEKAVQAGSGDGGFSWNTPVDTPDEEPTTTTRTATPTRAPDTTQTVSGPGGISVEIPAGWAVGGSPADANQQASDPADPQVFVRFGASAPPDVPILTEIQNGETGNPNVQNGYRRVQLVESSFHGLPAANWEFTFVKDGLTRHAHGLYWREDGLTYVIYLSAPADRWASVEWIFAGMVDSANVF